MDFKNSETKVNLMRAFAGGSQARNRYTFAAGIAREQNLHVIEAIFNFTAGQEKEHAQIFFNHLKELNGESVEICGGYPVEVTNSVVELLKFAAHDEYEEHEVVYKEFESKAQEEGFPAVANSFKMIGEIEKIHGDRFKKFAELLEQNKLFVSDVQCKWMCLNCGHIYDGKEVPQICPVCQHDKGYFIRLELAPYVGCECK